MGEARRPRRVTTFEEWRELARTGPRRWIIYGVEDKPDNIILSVLLGLQQYLIMFGATVAVPFIVSGWIISTYQITDPEVASLFRANLITITFFAAGVTTLLQLWPKTGSGLPIIQGSSFSFLGPVYSIIASTLIIAQAEGYSSFEEFIAATDEWTRISIVMQYVTGAILAASFFEIILGYSGIMGKIKRYITPVSIGPTVTLIGLTLFRAPAAMGVQYCAWEAFLVVLMIVILNQIIGKKFIRVQIFSILMSIIIVWAFVAILTAAGIVQPPCAVKFEPLRDMVERGYYVRPPIPFPWGIPKILPAFALGMLAAYLASMVESIGDYHSVARLAEAPPPTEGMISKGLGAEGLGCLIGAIFGAGGGFTSYSENIGSIGLTRVASRYVFQLGGIIILVIGGIIYAWGALMASMPDPLVGGMYIAVFGMIAAVGISLLMLSDMKSPRNIFIVGLSLFAGMAVPELVTDEVAAAMRAAFGGLAWVADIIIIIGRTGMAVGAIIGILLDNILPATPEERGLTHPEWTL